MDIRDTLLQGLGPRAAPDGGERRPLTEADFARSYVTYSELFGSNPTREMFFDRLRGTGLQSVMASLSFINSVLYISSRYGYALRQIHLRNHWFDPPGRHLWLCAPT
jgi:hypothetical protein